METDRERAPDKNEQILRSAFGTFVSDLKRAGVDAVAFIGIAPDLSTPVVLSTEIFLPITRAESSMQKRQAASDAHAKFSKALVELGVQTGHSFVNTENFSVEELEPLCRERWKQTQGAESVELIRLKN